MPIRPLLLVAALVAGDYLLWNWSSGGVSTTIALISGLALAPLILAFIWLISVTGTRLLVGSSRRSSRPPAKKSAPLAELPKSGEATRRPSERQPSEKIAA